MSEETTLLYLETDDEVTSVARRLRDAGGERIVLVAPGRSRAMSSVVALQLLARIAEEADRRVSVVGDALTRSLAVEAGLEAYSSVEDARNAVPAPAEAQAPRASIHVVRGGAADGTETVALAALPTPVRIDADTETRPVPVVRPPASLRRAPVAHDRASRRAIPLVVLLGGLAALLIGAGVLGAAVLPAATVTIVPASAPLGPVTYEIRIEDPDQVRGTVEATAPVTATGTYPIQVAATGTVVLYNWTFSPVTVPAGTFVAAGEQAFATQADVVVPRGRLTGQGTIGAGDIAVAVAAAVAGPAANVAPGAISVVVDQGVDQQLRGFPENPERRVDNPEATVGGIDDTGPEITQADVDQARATLLQALDVAVADALVATRDALFADPAEPPEPVIDGLDGLIGTRDQASGEISGTLAYDRLAVDRDEVVSLATERLLTDTAVLPPGHELLPSATEVSIGAAQREGDALIVTVTVTGASTPVIDRNQVLERVRGLSADEARSALADLGDPTIDLWPGWVGSVPDLEWRIEVRIAGVDVVTPLPSSSASVAP